MWGSFLLTLELSQKWHQRELSLAAHRALLTGRIFLALLVWFVLAMMTIRIYQALPWPDSTFKHSLEFGLGIMAGFKPVWAKWQRRA